MDVQKCIDNQAHSWLEWDAQMNKISLLDLLFVQMDCMYLSDLHFLSEGQQRLLANQLEQIALTEEDMQDWNDALVYLTGAQPAQTAQAAKQQLIRRLGGMSS